MLFSLHTLLFGKICQHPSVDFHALCFLMLHSAWAPILFDYTRSGRRSQFIRRALRFSRVSLICARFGYAKLDKSDDNWLNYPSGAFSRLLNCCITPGFWINSMIFLLSYTIFGSFSMPLGSVCGLAAG